MFRRGYGLVQALAAWGRLHVGIHVHVEQAALGLRSMIGVCMCICFMLLWRFQCTQLKIFPDTQHKCDNLVYYLVMHAHMKPDSTVDTLWVLHETR